MYPFSSHGPKPLSLLSFVVCIIFVTRFPHFTQYPNPCPFSIDLPLPVSPSLHYRVDSNRLCIYSVRILTLELRRLIPPLVVNCKWSILMKPTVSSATPSLASWSIFFWLLSIHWPLRGWPTFLVTLLWVHPVSPTSSIFRQWVECLLPLLLRRRDRSSRPSYCQCVRVEFVWTRRG